MNTATCCPPSTLVPAATTQSTVFALSGAPVARRAPLPALAGVERRGIPLHRPRWQRVWLALRERWAAWRAEARRRSELRALATLDRRVLRDVGLEESLPPLQAVTWHDLERGRW